MSVSHQREPSWNVHRRGLDLVAKKWPVHRRFSRRLKRSCNQRSKFWLKAKLVWQHSRPNQWRRGSMFLQLCQPILPELPCVLRIATGVCVLNCSVQSEVGRERYRKPGQEFVEFHSRFGPSEPEWSGSPRIPSGTEPAQLNGHADASVRMETMIDNAESIFRSNRFNPLQVDGRSDKTRARVGRVQRNACGT